MGSKIAGFSSGKRFDPFSGELVELPCGNVALNLRVPLGSPERLEPLAEDSQVSAAPFVPRPFPVTLQLDSYGNLVAGYCAINLDFLLEHLRGRAPTVGDERVLGFEVGAG